MHVAVDLLLLSLGADLHISNTRLKNEYRRLAHGHNRRLQLFGGVPAEGQCGWIALLDIACIGAPGMENPRCVELEVPGVELETPEVELETPGVELETPGLELEMPGIELWTPAGLPTSPDLYARSHPTPRDREVLPPLRAHPEPLRRVLHLLAGFVKASGGGLQATSLAVI